MGSDAVAVRSALKFITGECALVCRFCFSANFHDAVSIQDPVNVSRPHIIEEQLTIFEMLNTLGIPDDPSLPQSMCGVCATAIINSYIFHTTCQHAIEKWRETINSLENCLNKSETINPSSKTAYLLINVEQNTVVTSRKNLRNNKPAAVKTLKQLLHRMQYYEVHGVSKYVCAVCGNQFSSTSNLNHHMKRHKLDSVKRDKITCPQCLKQFALKIQLQDHAERVHFPKTTKCPQCEKMFGSLRMVEKHIKLHHQPVFCKLCSLQLSSRKKLQVHMDMHQVNKCSYCEKTFKNKNVYKLHLKICSPKEMNPAYLCDICGKAYLRKNGLRTHLVTSHGFGKTYNCKWCDKKYDALSTLNNHIVTHTKEKKFHCERCGGRFVTQPALTYHMRLHTGEKPYKCDECGERFLSASRRAEHRRRKHIGPQFACTFCHTKFVTKHQLFMHERRHNDPKSKLYFNRFPPRKTVVKSEPSKVPTKFVQKLQKRIVLRQSIDK